MAPDDPDLMLAAACCRWPPSPTRDDAVRAAAARIVDWQRFRRVVFRQRVAGLVKDGLARAGVAAPSDVAAAIARDARSILRQSLAGAAETARLVRLIEDAGYPVLAIKGEALAVLIYGSVGMKHSKDIDLLILPEDAGAVIALIEADAYRLTFPAERLTMSQRRVLPRYCKDVAMVRGAGHLPLELHWRMFGNTALLPAITARSASQLVAFSAAARVKTLATPDLYAYLAQHGAADGWSRLKWLGDVAALLAPLDGAAITALHRHAAGLGAELASLQTLTMAHEMIGLAVPAPLLAEARGNRRVRAMIAGAYRLMAVKDGETETPDWWRGQMLLLLMQPLVARGLRHKWQIVRAALYVQPDMFSSAAPPALYAFYPIVRLPLWIVRKIDAIARAVAPRATPLQGRKS